MEMVRKIFSFLLWIKTVTVLAMFILLFVFYMQVISSFNVYPNYWIPLVLLVPGVVAPVLIWKCVRSGRKGKWIPAFFYVESLYTLIVAFLYFSEVMHDIAIMYFGHHGRFGVIDLDGGMSPYLVNDTTLPLILFVPVIIAGILYFLLARREAAAGEKAAQ